MTLAPASAESGLPYRPCVGIALIDRAGRVFVGRRRKEAGPEHVAGPHAWQMPQGGIDPGEDPRRAAIRELYEETNVAEGSLTFLAETPGWLAYDLPTEIIKQAWKGRYRGQEQKWFAFGFLGTDDEIDVITPGNGAHKSEFEDWRWQDFDGLADLIVPFKRPVYEAVVEAFAPLAQWRGA